MKRKVVFIGLALLLLALPLAACAKPAPPPAPAPIPVPAPTPAPAPKTPTDIMLGVGRVGDPWSVLGEALAYYIGRDSDWLRATAVATPGLTGAVKMAMAEPEKYVLSVSPLTLLNIQKLADWGNYDKMRWIGALTTETWVWATYDENIKELKDLAGKNVFIGREGGWLTPGQKLIIEKAGVLDSVNLSHGGWGSGANALRDGLVDVTALLIDHMWPASFSKGSAITELETRKPIYYINNNPEVLRDASTPKPGEVWPDYGILPTRIFPGAFGKRMPAEEIWATGMPVMWAADERVDEDIIYEVTRILYERASRGDFAVWHAMGSNLNDEFLPTYLFSEELMHPGAVKYYKEQGIKLNNLLDLLP